MRKRQLARCFCLYRKYLSILRLFCDLIKLSSEDSWNKVIKLKDKDQIIPKIKKLIEANSHRTVKRKFWFFLLPFIYTQKNWKSRKFIFAQEYLKTW